jgi:hypothetical protein
MDQGVERKVLWDFAVENCFDRGWAERGEGIDSLDVRVIQLMDPGKISDPRCFPTNDTIPPSASPRYSFKDRQSARSERGLLITDDQPHSFSSFSVAEGTPQGDHLAIGF